MLKHLQKLSAAQNEAHFRSLACTHAKSSKAFIVQLAGLLMLVGAIWHLRGRDSHKEQQLVSALQSLPVKQEQTLGMFEAIQAIAEDFADKHHSLFLGQGDQYPISMEGALKLTEISYIYAEAYAAGELKHGHFHISVLESAVDPIDLTTRGWEWSSQDLQIENSPIIFFDIAFKVLAQNLRTVCA